MKTLPRMDIEAPRGTQVIFDAPTNGYPFHQELANKHLRIGGIYTVLKTEVFSSSTKVYFEEFPEIGFNSVLFGSLSVMTV